MLSIFRSKADKSTAAAVPPLLLLPISAVVAAVPPIPQAHALSPPMPIPPAAAVDEGIGVLLRRGVTAALGLLFRPFDALRFFAAAVSVVGGEGSKERGPYSASKPPEGGYSDDAVPPPPRAAESARFRRPAAVTAETAGDVAVAEGDGEGETDASSVSML